MNRQRVVLPDSNNDRCKRAGFTLIELLVVISIIALLLSILMPSLQKAKAMAKSTVCKARLNQMYLGLSLYAEDNDNKYLKQHWDSPMDYWFARMAPYVKGGGSSTHHTYGFLRCPSGPANKEYGKREAPFAWGALDYAFQYSPNTKITQFKRTSGFAPFFDYTYTFPSAFDPLPTSGSVYESLFKRSMDLDNPHNKTKAMWRHNKGANAVFMDGHVGHFKEMTWEDISTRDAH